MKTPRLTEVDGFKLPPTFDPGTFRDVCKYKPGKGRVVVATFPKCGTTWMQQVTILILRKGMPPADADEYFSLLPFMEMTPVSILENLREDGCMKTHLPFDRIAFSEEAKYIYVARHPEDCVVSFYHHMRFFPVYFFSDGTFDDFFELFITGQTDFGDYFDHLLSWYEQRNRPNILFTTYEGMKADPRGMVLKIAKFIGEDYYKTLIADDERVLKNVLKYSAVDYMKETVDKFWEDSFSNVPSEEVQNAIPTMKNYAQVFAEATENGHKSIGHFIRKGSVGEGKIILSEEQKKRLDSRIREKCANSDVMSLWSRP